MPQGAVPAVNRRRAGVWCEVWCDAVRRVCRYEVRAAGANRYAAAKDRRAHKTIKDKNLRIGFKAITFGSYGSFGTSTHLLINKATADAQQSVFNPWVRPGPRQHAYLLFGFSLARANARMLLNADSKRRSARNSVRASRPQSTSAVAVHG